MLRLLGLLAAASFCALSAAETRWPERPVRVIVAGPAGSALDALNRLVVERLGARLGQPFVPDFRPGASGTIAADALLRAAADGHTLLVAPNGLATEVPHTVPVRFDPLRDLKPLAELGRTTLVLAGKRDLAAGDLGALIRDVKAAPDKFAYASYGAGTLSHISGLLLGRIAGLDWLHISYKGTPQALSDVMGGQVPLMFAPLVSAAPLAKAGRIKAYAVTSAQRSPFLPEVPTFRELGYPQLAYSGWIGLFGPRQLAAGLALTINAEIVRELASPAARERLAQLYVDAPRASMPLDLQQELRADYIRNARLLEAFGLHPQ